MRLRHFATCLEHVETTDRDRQLLALKLQSPNRAPAGAAIQPQHNTDALPLFDSAAQPNLF